MLIYNLMPHIFKIITQFMEVGVEAQLITALLIGQNLSLKLVRLDLLR